MITRGLLTVLERLRLIEKHPALRVTPAQHQAAMAAAGLELIAKAEVRINAATEAFKREQSHLAFMIGTVRTRLIPYSPARPDLAAAH